MASSWFRWCLNKSRQDVGVLVLNLGTAISLTGFWMSDSLTLRTCAIAGGISSVYFNLTRKPPLLVPVYWSLAFFSANVYNIAILLKERSDVELSEEAEEIYVRHFLPCGMPPRHFLQLLDHSKVQEFGAGKTLMIQGSTEHSDKIYLLLQGKLKIMVNGKEVGEMSSEKPMCFVGEMGLLEKETKKEFTQMLPQAIKSLKYHHITSPISSSSSWVSSWINGWRNDGDIGDSEVPRIEIGAAGSSQPTQLLEEAGVAADAKAKAVADSSHCATVAIDADGPAILLEWDKRFFLDLLSERSEMSLLLRSLFLETVLRKLRKTIKKASVPSSPYNSAESVTVISSAAVDTATTMAGGRNGDTTLDESDLIEKTTIVALSSNNKKENMRENAKNEESATRRRNEAVYRALMAACLKDESRISDLHMEGLERFRVQNDIASEVHSEAVQSFGWTVEQYMTGMRGIYGSEGGTAKSSTPERQSAAKDSLKERSLSSVERLSSSANFVEESCDVQAITAPAAMSTISMKIKD